MKRLVELCTLGRNEQLTVIFLFAGLVLISAIKSYREGAQSSPPAATATAADQPSLSPGIRP